MLKSVHLLHESELLSDGTNGLVCAMPVHNLGSDIHIAIYKMLLKMGLVHFDC